jgi:hypothetical protein
VNAYYPGANVHPIEPEAFFARDAATLAGLVELKMLESAAG